MTGTTSTVPYDARRDALYHPESDPAVPMTGWSPDAVAAECARLAYCRFETSEAARRSIETAVGTIGYRRLGWFSDPRDVPSRRRFDAQAFAAVREDGHAIVAFRGTQPDSFRDLLVDARFRPVRWPSAGWVHAGFRDALLSIVGPIETWLATVGATALTITGHSLGGALATLAASRQPHADLVTFGSPRVGDSAFAALLHGQNVRRYVDCTDIVTQLPPPPVYAHTDGLRYIDHGGTVHTSPTPALSLLDDHLAAEAAYAAVMWHPENVLLRSFADHAPANYVSAVRGVRVGP